MAQTIYLDMDGVIADFVAGAAEITGHRLSDPTQMYKDEDWVKIRDHQHIFRNLPLMPYANEIADVARRFRDELGWGLLFLTAIPHYNDMPWSFWDKIKWVEEHFPDIPVHFGPYAADKRSHCTPGDILVDDRLDNCIQWRGAEGVAIHVTDTALAFAELKKLLDNKLSLMQLNQ